MKGWLPKTRQSRVLPGMGVLGSLLGSLSSLGLSWAGLGSPPGGGCLRVHFASLGFPGGFLLVKDINHECI